ncbi:MBL fold metallo-hydrolase [Patescibacteria group bacterium]|nr:MBL fold metallo-hydrolase [Patescibacteria group bacterium]
MKITFYGGAGTVTGAKYLLETKSAKILVECGMFQGENSDEENYKEFPFNCSEIDYVFLTHSHVDHIGMLPKLYKQGFKGRVFFTPPSLDIARLILQDSQEIMQRQATRDNVNPVFEMEHVNGILGLAETVDYNKKKKLNEEIYFRFQDAGHILGSAIIEIWANGKKLVFSGDLGNDPTPLLNSPKKITQADYVIIESTYGDRLHEDRFKRKELLENVIEENHSKRGVLMIPAFAIERTQELLYELNELVENNRIPRIPIFIDSPLAIEITRVYKKHQKYFNKQANDLIKTGDDLFNFPKLTLTEKVNQSKSINNIASPKIIIAGSGMSTGGRILFHEKLYLPDPNNTLLIISFQVRGTLGRKLSEGAKRVWIFNENVNVKAKIVSIEGYSSHADQQGLYDWLNNFSKPVKKVFIVHGEEEASNALSQRVKDHLGLDTNIPKIGESFDL